MQQTCAKMTGAGTIKQACHNLQTPTMPEKTSTSREC